MVLARLAKKLANFVMARYPDPNAGEKPYGHDECIPPQSDEGVG